METKHFLYVTLNIMELPSELYQVQPQLLFLNNLAPCYIRNLPHFCTPNRFLWSSSQFRLQVPPSNFKTYGHRAFSVCAPNYIRFRIIIIYQVQYYIRFSIYIRFSKSSAPTIAFLAFDWLKNSDYEPIVGVLRHMENSACDFFIYFFFFAKRKPASFIMARQRIGSNLRFVSLSIGYFFSWLADFLVGDAPEGRVQ